VATDASGRSSREHCTDANPALLAHAGLGGARVLLIAFSDAPSTRHVVEYARRMHPRLSIVARTHGEEEWAFLRDNGVDEVVRGEHEVAVEMSRLRCQSATCSW
jgi:CPA2 family monovalent cation:H+ antiporter-2